MVDQIGLGPCETGFTHRTSSPQQSCKALRSFMAQQSTDLAEEKKMKLSPPSFCRDEFKQKKWNQNPPLGLLCWSFRVFRLPRCLSFLSKSIDVFSDVLCFFQTFLGVPLSQITSSSFQNIPTGHMGAGIVPTPTGQSDSSVHSEFRTQKFPGYNLAAATVTSQNQVGQVGAWSFFLQEKNLCHFSETKTSSATRPCSVLCCAMVPPSGASGASSCDTTWLLSGK